MEKETGIRETTRKGAKGKSGSGGDSNSISNVSNTDASANVINTGSSVSVSAFFVVSGQEGEADGGFFNKVVGREVGEGLQGAAEDQDIVVDGISNSNITETVVNTGEVPVDTEVKRVEKQGRKGRSVEGVVEVVAKEAVVKSRFPNEAFQIFKGLLVECIQI